MFIRFPKTLFDIEDRLQRRRHELGESSIAWCGGYVHLCLLLLVTMLIANWRMCIARRRYQNLKAASKSVIGFRSNQPIDL